MTVNCCTAFNLNDFSNNFCGFSLLLSLPTSADDIPIQAGDEGATSNVSQLISITEESETSGGGGGSSEPLGMRNNLVRSSKEILKTHKVPFPGFKKKDKDKEKDKTVSIEMLSMKFRWMLIRLLFSR